jgi:hypothetical protein
MLVPSRVERFWAGVPRPFLERVLRSVFDNYVLADEFCGEFDKPERINTRPFIRRALVERSVRDIARQFPGQITAEAVRHEDKGFWFHTRVVCNGDVALTQNTVPNPDILVRNSCFRNCYAGPNNQQYLFPEMAPDDLPNDSLLYGILLHGRSPESAVTPGFAQIRFPKRRLSGYYQERINLFMEFPEVVDEKVAELPQLAGEEIELEPELIDPFDLPGADALGTG